MNYRSLLIVCLATGYPYCDERRSPVVGKLE